MLTLVLFPLKCPFFPVHVCIYSILYI